MSNTINKTPRPGASKTQFSISLQQFSGVLFAVFLLAWSSGQAQVPEKEEQYLHIYDLIQQADTLSANGETGPALAKYRQAQTALRSFQRTYPEWNPKAVSFRSNYLTTRVVALAQKASGASAAQSETKATGGSSTRVTLVDPGDEPRKVLRLHPAEGDKQALTMTVNMSMDMKVGEMQNPAMKLPASKMTIDITVKSVSTDGDITYDLAVRDATVADEPGVMPQITEAMKTSMASIKGLSGTGTTSNRGLSKAADIKVPADADPQTRQVIDQMKEAFSKFAPVLPEEAVGTGGKWEVKMPIKSQGITIDQTATYELVTMEGEHIRAKNTIAQRASNQKIQNPAMAGATVDLTKMVGNGTGELTFELNQLIPAEATLESHSELSMGMNMGGQKQAMTMKLDLNLRLEAK